MSISHSPGPQRLTLVSARQEWKKQCVALDQKYRHERSDLDLRKDNQLSSVSASNNDYQRQLRVHEVTAEHKQRVLDLDAHHLQEAQDFVIRDMAFNEPPNRHRPSYIGESRVSDESTVTVKPIVMDTKRPAAAAGLAKSEMKVTDGDYLWELHDTTVRSVPLQTPTMASSSNLDLETSNPKRRVGEDHSSYPKRQRLAESVNRIKTITYADVRKNAIDHGHWDTIIKWPETSEQFWVCFCESHRVHFKQRAEVAAAKHFSGSLHGHPNRDRRPAMVELGYYIPDCTSKLRDLHNAEVNNKFAAGYIPQNHHKRDTKRKDQPGSFSDRSPRRTIASASAANPTTKTSLITNPKTAHVYYAKYDGQHWAVVILGWDRLPDGCPHSTLGESKLIKTEPPSCYNFEREQRIIGWKPKYMDGGTSVHNRQFPVMFFDEEQNYGWVPAKDLSKLDLNNPPMETKDYPEESYNAARNWIAQRMGYENWENLNAARKGLRVKASAGPVSKSPDDVRSGFKVPRSRESSGSLAPESENVNTESPSGIKSTEKLPSSKDTLKRLPNNQEASRNTSSGLQWPQHLSGAHVPNGTHSAISTSTVNHALSSGPLRPPLKTSTPAVLGPAASSGLISGPPVKIPLTSAPSPQMPTPSTPTQAQVGTETFAGDSYELSAYELETNKDGQVQGQLIWQRGSRSEPCVKLIIAADGRTAQVEEGAPFELTINPPECRQIRLKTPLGDDGLPNAHGIGYVTLHLVSGEPSIRITFDRSDDGGGTWGCRRQRQFSRWLWGQNPKMRS